MKRNPRFRGKVKRRGVIKSGTGVVPEVSAVGFSQKGSIREDDRKEEEGEEAEAEN